MGAVKRNKYGQVDVRPGLSVGCAGLPGQTGHDRATPEAAVNTLKMVGDGVLFLDAYTVLAALNKGIEGTQGQAIPIGPQRSRRLSQPRNQA